VYPNPLVADLIAAAIADRIALFHDHRVEPSADILAALGRLESELKELESAVDTAINFLEGRSLGAPGSVSQGDCAPARAARA